MTDSGSVAPTPGETAPENPYNGLSPSTTPDDPSPGSLTPEEYAQKYGLSNAPEGTRTVRTIIVEATVPIGAQQHALPVPTVMDIQGVGSGEATILIRQNPENHMEALFEITGVAADQTVTYNFGVSPACDGDVPANGASSPNPPPAGSTSRSCTTASPRAPAAPSS